MIVCVPITYASPPYLHQDNVLQFFAKIFSSSPLNVTREIYTSLGRPFWMDWVIVQHLHIWTEHRKSIYFNYILKGQTHTASII